MDWTVAAVAGEVLLMSVATANLQDLVALTLALAAGFVAFSLLDSAPPAGLLRRWARRLGSALALLLAVLALEPARSAATPGPIAPLPLLLWCLGAATGSLVLEQRQRSSLFYALGALPGALLLAAGYALAEARDVSLQNLLGRPATAYLLLACSLAWALEGRFRRRRGGSPLPLGLAAATLLALGLLTQRLTSPASSAVDGAAAGLGLTVSAGMALLMLACAAYLARARWLAQHTQDGGLRRGGRSDPVSGLPTLEVAAESFVRILRLAVAGHGACALVVLSFEALERILATQGRAERDRLYATAAWRLRSARRDEELIAAMGEQRFLLALRVSDSADATRRVRELLAMFEQPLGDGEARVRLRPSAGLSLWPDHGDDFPRLLANALVALERCPPGGLQMFHAAQREESEQRLRVETSIGRALVEGEIGLVLQPIIDTLSGDVRLVELLARWNHPEIGNISPRQFILIAESSGAIGEFDRWLLREAISTTKWLDAAGFPQIRVALNCSPVNLVDAAFLDDFERTVLDSGISPARLEVEVTEAALAEGERAVVDSLVRLRSLGVGLTIDDFGIGHSSLARLRDLPVDTLKIDQSFIRDMDHPKGEFLVSGILGLAHGLGKAVIAEGIETRAQRSTLADLGCEYLQGFLISHPLSWRSLLDFLGADTGAARRPAATPPRAAENPPA
jgi:EAL domain-containing protein (putative c-di-GMP-specific phosphodiesterase class I)/GGDEF domain-containing protein